MVQWPQGRGRAVRPTQADLRSLKRCCRIVVLVTRIEHRLGRNFKTDQAEDLWAEMRRKPLDDLDREIAQLEEVLANTPPLGRGPLPLEFEFDGEGELAC